MQAWPVVHFSKFNETLPRFRATLPKEDEANPTKIEAAFKKFCKPLKLKENRYFPSSCELYSLPTFICKFQILLLSWGNCRCCHRKSGSYEQASLMGDAKVSWSDNFTSFDQYNNFLFSDKVCEKLKKTDRQICELTYEKQIDFSTVDLKKLKVKDLKKILSEWDEVGTLLFPCRIMFWQNLFSGVWWLSGEGRLHQADRGAEAKACPHWALRRPSDICDFFYDGAYKQFGLPDMPNA